MKKNLKERLIKEKTRLDLVTLREPKTVKELLNRKRWDRLHNIIRRRYEEKNMSKL